MMMFYKKAGSYLKTLLLVSVVVPITAMAELSSLSDDDMAKKSGQTGITLGLDVVINKIDNDNSGNKDCSKPGQCQFGLQLDNQNDPNLWATLTGVSGGMTLKASVESVDVVRNGNTQGAVKITYQNTGDDKAVFSDFGYDSLRLSENTATAEGYRNTAAFGTGVDAGRQQGFLGMRIHGPAELSGSATMFDCGTCE